MTTADQTQLLARQSDIPMVAAGHPTIRVDASQPFQSVDGFGAALTGSSAYLLTRVLSGSQQAAALRDLFDPVAGAGLSYIRLPAGSTDFSLSNYTYDVAARQSDPALAYFSIAPDLLDTVPVLSRCSRLRSSNCSGPYCHRDGPVGSSSDR